MRNLLFKIAFDGSRFHGWQQQENAATVQGELRKAWKLLTGEDANIIGCSRTDAGVHALEYYFSVKTESTIPVDKFPIALSSAKLTGAIAIYSCREVPDLFNARFDCLKKEYKYVIDNTLVQSPFLYKHSLNYPYTLDEKLMDKAAKAFVGEHDFSAFCAADTEVLSKVRTIFSAGVSRVGDSVEFRVCGNGFLYNMVRIMAGTLIYVNNGKIDAESIPDIIESKDRTRAGITAKPDGLYLNKVFYGDGLTDESKI